jgi:uncharacterized protein
VEQINEETNSDSLQGKYSVTFGTRKLLVISLIYLAASGAAEYTSHYLNPVGGIAFYLVILFSLIVNGALAKDQAQRGLWLALGLAPIIRLVSLAMPIMMEISQFIWYIIISIPILVAIFTVARTLKYSFEDVGLAWSKPLMQGLIVIAGIGLALADYFILKPSAWTATLTLQSTLFPALVLLIFTGFTEELAFRGVMQRAAKVLGSRGWVYSSLIYAVLQIGQGHPLNSVYILGISLLFGWTVQKTGSIIGVAMAHGLFNVGLYLIFPHLFF